jgi:Fe2+ transport system protein B
MADDPGNYEIATGGRMAESVPVPDPTRLSTEALNAAKAQWRLDLEALRELLEIRLTGMDRATQLVAGQAHGLTGQTKEQVDHLQELHEERFASIALQFKERDERSAQLAKTQDEALKAALQSAEKLNDAQGSANKEANAKTEITFGQQIKAVEDKIEVINRRLDTGQGAQEGTSSQRTEQRMDRGAGNQMVITAIMIVSVLIALVSVIAFVLKK